MSEAALSQPFTGRTATGSRASVSVVAATVIGNALEFYDFLAYAFFAVYIGKAFFPSVNPLNSLLASVAVFGVGFLFRPLGGIIIGAYADRAGRKPAMLLTIVLITVGTIGLALTPSYASIGAAAPIIVVTCRLVQGLALGGEVGPASAFLIEIAPPGKRGFYSSWQLASQGGAAFVAASIGITMSFILSPDDLESWGWRVPFIVCIALVPVAIYLRRAMPETLHESASRRNNKERVSAHSGIITLSIFVILGGTVSSYVGNYMTTYAIATLKLSPSIALGATVVGGLTTFIFALVGGRLADRFGRRSVMIIPRILLAIVTWPLFLLLQASPTSTTLFTVSVLLSILTSISGAASLVAIPELLPSSIRATGLSIAYAVGVSLFGGTTQFVITYLIGATGDPTAPGWYVTLASIISLLAMRALPETVDRPLSVE